MENTCKSNEEDYVLSFSDETENGLNSLLKAVFSNADLKSKAYAANVLIGNIPAKSVAESVGDEFNLCGFHIKDFVYNGGQNKGKNGKYTFLFGGCGTPCAYETSSMKIYEALQMITLVYGQPSAWGESIRVKIRMNMLEKGGKAYSLEVL